jgi:23S rRNA pseudouridine1911/1915/1917 synthase
MTAGQIEIESEQAGKTLAAVFRSVRPNLSWSQVRQLIASRHARLNNELCLDPARRLKEGDVVEILTKPERLPTALTAELVIRHVDEHLVVVEKPAGMSTTRHPAERNWSQRRRELSPTLDGRLQKRLAVKFKKQLHQLPRLRKVHRLDKLTSGLLVFARSALAERELGRQFHAHTVDRRYLAIVHGQPKPQVIRSTLVRDRGDGRRGSSKSGEGKLAVTHIEKVEPFGKYSVATCRLETGRTHQIRIHLAELGHPVLGDPVYGEARESLSRLALHAAELGFTHPATGERMNWTMPMPNDLQTLVHRHDSEQN